MKNLTQIIVAAGLYTLTAAAASADVPVANAYQMGSQANKWGFITFPINNIDGLTLVKPTSSSGEQISAAEGVNGKIYAYTVIYDIYMGDGLEQESFVIYNASDFSKVKSTDASGYGRVVDMAYDYRHHTMYALVENKKADNGLGLTALNTVDMATGALTQVGLPGDIKAQDGNGKTVEEHLVTLASDPTDGTLYAMGEYRQLYKLDRTTGAATPVGARHKVAVINDFQSMAFSPDGTLYHAQQHPDYSYFMQIDKTDGSLINPVTGEKVVVNADFTNTAARFKDDPQVTGLWFSGHNYVSSVPRSVTDLKSTVSDTDPNRVTLEWQLPTANIDGTSAAITGINVYRYGTSGVLATLPATATSYVDPKSPNGNVTYSVAAISADGDGIPASVTVFAGADMLKAVTNLTAELNGNEVTLSWTAPTATVNGGYSDYANITYSISSLLGTQVTPLQTGVKGNTFNYTLPASGTYSFLVIPESCGVEGLPSTSNSVTYQASAAESLPYECGFGDDQGGTLWTAVNKSTGTNGWSIQSGYAYQQLDGKYAQFKTGGSATIPTDDWFFSPAIECPAGDYTLSFYACGGSFDTHTFKVFAGPDTKTAADFTQELLRLEAQKVYAESTDNNHFVPYTVDFKIAEGGAHRIAFQGIGNATYATIRFDNVKLAAKNAGISDIVYLSSYSYDAATRTVSCAGASITAYDLTGRVAATGKSELTLPAEGIYLIEVREDSGVYRTKVLAR